MFVLFSIFGKNITLYILCISFYVIYSYMLNFLIIFPSTLNKYLAAVRVLGDKRGASVEGGRGTLFVVGLKIVLVKE